MTRFFHQTKFMSEANNSTRNKAPAAIQITAEQLLREAHLARDAVKPAPRQRIADEKELRDYQAIKRTEFENAFRRNRTAVGGKFDLLHRITAHLPDALLLTY